MMRISGFRWAAAASVVVGLALVGAGLPAEAAPVPSAGPSPTAAPVVAAAATPSPKVGPLADTTTYQVTVAARTCTGFDVIMANRARNNIQESLRDLGPDTLYTQGQAISPAVEDVQATTQVSGCRPLVGWKFQLGRGIAGKVDKLSTVSNPFPETHTTLPDVAERDQTGKETGPRLAGAVTFSLTQAQADLAVQQSRLWIQGGTTSDPLLNSGSPPFDPAQAFGALRCSIDNLNGDNVEWIGYPTNATHVFCYYFTVSPAPDAATIVVKKTLKGVTGTRQFQFRGNVSYIPNPDSDNPDLNPFTVTSGSSITFVRAAGNPVNWNFFEEPDESYPLQDVVCVSTDPAAQIINPGANTSQTNPVRITVLPAGSTVTCEFINAEEPPPAPATSRIVVDKVTATGVGTFRITADHPDVPAKRARVTTIEPTVPERAVELEAPAGDFTIRETLPSGVDPSAWRMTKLSCDNGYVNTKTKIGNTYTIPVAEGDQVTCEVLNTPQGRINIRKVTKGGFGTFYFGIIPEGEFEIPGVGGGVALSATTDSSGDTATAKPIPGHGSNTRLPFQDYAVVEFAETTPLGTWTLDKVECTNVKEKPVRVGGVVGARFALTPQEPEVTCTFTNSFKADPGESKWATLDLSKSVVGPAGSRSSDVVINVTCDDGQTRELRKTAEQVGTTGWSEPMVFSTFPGGEVDCTIVESATGATSGYDVAVKMIVDRGETQSTSTGPRTSVRIKPKSRVAVEVRDTYSVFTERPSSD